jgi:ribosomal protein S18 acetylase RimI-like enzyme
MPPQVDVLPPDAASDELLVAEIVALINRAYALGEDGLWLEGTVRTRPPDIAAAIRSGGMLAATVDGELVGCAYVTSLDESTADVGLISVSPDQQGAGVGREIVRFAEDLMRERGARIAQLELLVPRDGTHPTKERLRAWYTRLGYEVVRTAPFDEIAGHGASELATPCEFLVFRKPLTG